MWAIRKAPVRIKTQAFSSATLRTLYAKLETTSSSVTENTTFNPPPPKRSLLLTRFSSQPHDAKSLFIVKHHFSTQVGEENDDVKESDNESIFEADVAELEEDDDDIGFENNREGKRGSSGLFKAIVNSTSSSANKALDNWLEEGNDLSRSEISHALYELRKRRMYGKALQLSGWLETKESIEFSERDYASRIDLIAKIRGLQKAESHLEKIPESFRGEIVYRTLLANSVLQNNVKKSEQIFNKMKDLKLQVSTFACNQLLLLYKRTDKRKIADVLLLMEKENIKPSVFTYRLLIDTKGQSNDIAGMEQVLETMKKEGLEPDLRLNTVLAKHYVYGGNTEKAKVVLKEMEGNDLDTNRRACSSLLIVYALLNSSDDVYRIWEFCKSDPHIEECMGAIDAFGRLKKVKEAEMIFDQMSKKFTSLSAKHYTAMLKVYANNKMLTEGKKFLKEMGESGCRIGPLTWDTLVKLYLECGEIEKADSILNKASQQISTKPMFATYMMILDAYAKRGDVHNAEKVFHRMRNDGYVSRFRMYSSLLQAYINGKVPCYGFRERLKADNVFPTKSLVAQLAQVDAFKKTAVSDLLD